MTILVINCGSSTLKFALIEAPAATTGAQYRRLAEGQVDRIGEDAEIDFTDTEGRAHRSKIKMVDHAQAVRQVLDWLHLTGDPGSPGVDAVGHRVVHGGEQFADPVRISDEVLDVIEGLSELAPLHNEPSLHAIRAARDALGLKVPMVAVFDTAFHRTLPEYAFRYAIPLELADRHAIRRYGFHGLAHRYMVERYAEITSVPLRQTRLITLHLGNGCSAAAVNGGLSVDTSMGLTPLEGLMMGTRSGDVDPSLAGFLARREGVHIAEAEDWLSTRSGLLGVSGRSNDMRALQAAEREGDERAGLAVEMFCHRARKYIGAYLASLGGADAVLFGGGIGEHAPAVRARICAGMDWCGLALDQERNEHAGGREERISAEGSRVEVYVIPVNEATIIAGDTLRCLQPEDEQRP